MLFRDQPHPVSKLDQLIGKYLAQLRSDWQIGTLRVD